MSTQNPASSPASGTNLQTPVTELAQDASVAAASRRRSYVLLGILAVLLTALWYDYRVARPNVELAYESIGKINSDFNALPGKKYVTEKEVQLTLNRKPASIIAEGPYHVEVYSWRAGLPIKSHNYYAVYSAGTPLIFLKHYKFELPMEELQVARMGAIGDEMTPEMQQQMTQVMEQGMQRQREAMIRSRTEPPGEETAEATKFQVDAIPADGPVKEPTATADSERSDEAGSAAAAPAEKTTAEK